MLIITVSGVEAFDEATQEFTIQGGTDLELEHSLASLSKWESIYEKPFLGTEQKTSEEVITYLECMALRSYPKKLFHQLSVEDLERLNAYIESKQSATWFRDQPAAPRSREVITAELIYYWMVTFGIPFECERWHLNRLFTLIRICNIKQSKPEKMSREELAQRNRELNAQRRAQLGTRG